MKTKTIPFDKELAMQKRYARVFINSSDVYSLYEITDLTYFEKADSFVGSVDSGVWRFNSKGVSESGYQLFMEVPKNMLYIAIYYYTEQPGIYYSLVYATEEAAKNSTLYQKNTSLLKIVEVDLD